MSGRLQRARPRGPPWRQNRASRLAYQISCSLQIRATIFKIGHQTKKQSPETRAPLAILRSLNFQGAHRPRNSNTTNYAALALAGSVLSEAFPWSYIAIGNTAPIPRSFL